MFMSTFCCVTGTTDGLVRFERRKVRNRNVFGVGCSGCIRFYLCTSRHKEIESTSGCLFFCVHLGNFKIWTFFWVWKKRTDSGDQRTLCSTLRMLHSCECSEQKQPMFIKNMYKNANLISGKRHC